MRLRTALAATALAAAGLITGPAATAAPAGALATCSGTACDHQDPVVTGCSAGSTTVDSVRTAKGTFELRWSPTCKTNWVRVGNYAGGGPRLYLVVCDEDRGLCTLYPSSTTAGVHYGNMIYSPGSNCATGFAEYDSDGAYEVGLASSSC